MSGINILDDPIEIDVQSMTHRVANAPTWHRWLTTAARENCHGAEAAWTEVIEMTSEKKKDIVYPLVN